MSFILISFSQWLRYAAWGNHKMVLHTSLTSWSPIMHNISSFSANEIKSRFLCCLKFNFHSHSRPQMVSVSSQTNPFLTLTTCFFKIHLNIILPSTSVSTERSHSSIYSDQILYAFSSLYKGDMTSLTQPRWPAHPDNMSNTHSL
jgi:hypothetical protein